MESRFEPDIIRGERESDYSYDDGAWGGYDVVHIEADERSPNFWDCKSTIWVEVPEDRLRDVLAFLKRPGMEDAA